MLTETEQGELVRQIAINIINVYYRTPEGKTLLLKEQKQVFKDGRERVRTQVVASLSEKLKAEEVPNADSVQRALAEELGISGVISAQSLGTTKEQDVSPSYPGLTTSTTIYKWETFLDDAQYKPEGYVEHQPDKSTYFVWTKT